MARAEGPWGMLSGAMTTRVSLSQPAYSCDLSAVKATVLTGKPDFMQVKNNTVVHSKRTPGMTYIIFLKGENMYCNSNYVHYL